MPQPLISHGFEDWLFDQLYLAYLDARRHKRHSKDEHNFEVNDVANIMQLRDDILTHQYKPSRGVAFIVNDPVQREIFAAPFRDRIVHHFLFNMVASWWDQRFIFDSYSCRPGKGTLFGVQRLQRHIRSVTQGGTHKAYVIKGDLQGYFMSLSRKRVYERVAWGLEQQFPDPKLAWKKDLIDYLWREIIFDDPAMNVRIRGSEKDWDGLPKNKSLFNQPPGQGIVIGNLSSQLISNIYLDQLDRFVTFDLGYKHYGRYVDDFYYLVPIEDLSRALKDLWRIKEYLLSLQLTLHPKKIYIQNVDHGVSFLGHIVYPHAIYSSARLKCNFRRALVDIISDQRSPQSFASYLGYFKHTKSKKFLCESIEEIGGRYQF